MSVKVLEKLADKLGVKVADFFEFDYQFSQEEQRKELLRKVKNASDSELQLLFKLAITLLK